MRDRTSLAAAMAMMLAFDGATGGERRRRYRRERAPKPKPEGGACKRDPRPWFNPEAPRA